MAESDQLTLNSSVAPAGILAGHPQHEGSDRRWGGWSAWRSVRVGPAAGDELGCQRNSVRGETSRTWRSGAGSSLLSALSTARSGQVSVGRVLRAAQYRDLVSQRQDLGVLGGVGAGEQRQPAQHANEHQVDESEGHSARSCWLSSGRYCRGRLPGTCCSEMVTGFSARTGSDFVEALEHALSHCAILVAIIGPRWVTVADTAGQPRLNDSDDYVRIEIERALGSPDIRVIPVLVNGAQMPTHAQLPKSLHPMLRTNAYSISHERFGSGITELMAAIEKVIPAASRFRRGDAS